MGSEKKGILLLPDLLGKGYIFKSSRTSMAYNKLLGVDTLWVQVGLQHLSFRFRGRPIMFLKQ